MLSTYPGKGPVSTYKRFDTNAREHVEIECPNAVLHCNRHMGGIDLMDSFIGRSKKWYLRIFYHLLDLCMVNAWLLYKRVMTLEGRQKEIIQQSKLRIEIAKCLCNARIKGTSKRGRPNCSLEQDIQSKRHRGHTQHVPPQEV